MKRRPLLFLHGIRGSRLAIREHGQTRVIWQLSDEENPQGHLLALRHEGGIPQPLDPDCPVFPLDHEPEVHDVFLQWARRRGPVHAPVWDWRLPPSSCAGEVAAGMPGGPWDVVVHSMGLHLLAELVMQGHMPLEAVHRLALVTPAFGGALDILHVLLSGADREADCGDATGRCYGALVRSLPALYRLLPVPGHGLLVDSLGGEIDPLDPARWPRDLGTDSLRDLPAQVLDGARRDRDTLAAFSTRLPELGGRALAMLATGMPTPTRCRMEGETMSCAVSRLEMTAGGDGRLALAAQLPRDLALPHELFGGEDDPIAHGDVLGRPDLLARLAAFLDS
jgi:hypothetical protein